MQSMQRAGTVPLYEFRWVRNGSYKCFGWTWRHFWWSRCHKSCFSEKNNEFYSTFCRVREDDAYSIDRPFPGTCEPPLQGLYTLFVCICHWEQLFLMICLMDIQFWCCFTWSWKLESMYMSWVKPEVTNTNHLANQPGSTRDELHSYPCSSMLIINLQIIYLSIYLSFYHLSIYLI